MVIIIYG